MEGNGSTLSNINIKTTGLSDEYSVSASFITTSRGIIRNLNISDSSFSATIYINYGTTATAAAFVGTLYGTIENCKTIGSGSVGAYCLYKSSWGGSSSNIGRSYAGGIAACGQGDIINCENNFYVTSTCFSGGIVATLEAVRTYTHVYATYRNSQISCCVNNGDIKAYNSVSPYQYFLSGGIIGSASPDVSIKGCINSGDITGINTSSSPNNRTIYTGGISGESGNIDSCYNMGNISSQTNICESYTGGIVGSGSATNCFSNGKISNSTICKDYYEKPAFYIGGITGNGNVTNCYVLGPISYFYHGASGGNYGTFTGTGTTANCVYLGDSVYNSSFVKESYCLEETYTGFDFSSKWTFDPMIEYKYPVPVETLTKPYFVEIENGNDVRYETVESVWPEMETNIILKDLEGNEFTTKLKSWMVPNIDISKVGLQSSDVIYQGVCAQQKVFIDVFEKQPIKIEISTMPTKTIYLKDEEEFDATGGTLTVYYDNLTSKDFELSVANIMGFDNSNRGTLNLVVSYLGCETTMDIEISEEIALIIKQMPSKLTYVQSQKISLSDLIVETVCNKEISRSVNINDLVVEANTDTIGTTTVILKYKNLSVTFDITVIAKEISNAIFVEPSDVIFYKGDTIEFETGYIAITYVSDDNYTENIPITSNLVKGYDENLTGYQKVTIYLNEKYFWELYINVKNPYTIGDLNGDDKVTDSDAIYLMYHIFFPDKYPIEQDCDFNNDGKITDSDAIYLMYHIFFPEKYPINKNN